MTGRQHQRSGADGFTLLEVLVALAVLGIAVVSFIQLSSKSLRLVKTSGDYQQAVELADRIARQTDPTEEGIDNGQEGPFLWERSVALVEVPQEFLPAVNVPGKEPPKLFSVKIDVRWGGGQVLELATLRTPTTPPPVTNQTAAASQGQENQVAQPGGGTLPGGAGQSTFGAQPGAGQSRSGGQQPFGSGSSTKSGMGSQQSGNPFAPRGRQTR